MKPTIIPAEVPAIRTSEGSLLQQLGRRALLGKLAGLTHGQLTILENGARWQFGHRTPDCELAATIDVIHPQFWADAAFGGTLGAGEAFIHEHWRCDDLTALVRIMVQNRDLVESMEGGWAVVSAPLRRVLHWLNRNSRDGSQRNIAAHYDLGNDFFALFLDPTMAYSCGIFEREDATMYEASIAKFDAICRKLALGPGDHLLEIGTGWGGLAIHAARHYGCRVTTTTISREQHDFARERIVEAGLTDRIELKLEDYRDLTGTYDKLVSVEMIEAVGHQYLDTYFSKCASLLAPDGAMLLQAITLQDQYYEDALKRVDFIQRFIFPGSFIPSVTAIIDSVTRATDMKLFHLVDIGPHYATTLRRWREAFFAALPAVKALGYPDAFVRMWDFYLCYCEGGFAERQLGDVHMLLTKPGCRI
ncbi:MAG TPA: cyclopropane-fatty-acyl-phospholipid synthase family protein [Steroidobacteraceae bacterium]|nr:cyclopropane-fatty-acyl-phospholipid synthase family protein [Steroidobacteraceae bacterium]